MTDSDCRTRFQITGLIAGLAVWTALSGIGEMSAPGGFLLGVLTWALLGSLLIWAVCEGDTGDAATRPSGDGDGIPGWVLVIIVLGLLVWIGLSGVGEMSGPAGFLFALLAMIALISLVVWSRRGGIEESDNRFAMLDTAHASHKPDSLLSAVAEPDVDDAEAEAPADDLRQIKGIGPTIEARLLDLGVRHYSQIASWSEDDINQIAEKLDWQAGRIISDDWIGQARQLLAGGDA